LPKAFQCSEEVRRRGGEEERRGEGEKGRRGEGEKGCIDINIQIPSAT